MKGLALAVLLGAVALAGCFDAPAAKSPLYAPKLVVDTMEDDRIELFVHNAWGERAYERIVLRVDNATLVDENHTHAAILKVPGEGFYLDVSVQARDEGAFAFTGRLDFLPEEERLRVVPHDPAAEAEHQWGDERMFNLPHERVLHRQEATE